ncbi:MAG: alpha/beta fold hydrolase, partial [Cytophagales bacterium]|nr:alpha/beta fold hydrolase [Cytophagales bacterium]
MNTPWLDQEEYPFTSHFMAIKGQNLHYVDEGKGKVIVFVHGTPSWSFDFRKLIRELRKEYRCIAIDHIGFGLSDKPEFYDYSTQNHSLTLEKFMLQLDLTDITLVVHDFGGPIGLNYAILHSYRIKQLIVLNTWLWSSESDVEFLRLRRLLKNPLLPILYRYFNFSPKFILPNSFGKHKIPKKTLKQYISPFKRPSERNGTIAFIYSLINDQGWFETLWNTSVAIQGKRTLFIWGMNDPVIRP